MKKILAIFTLLSFLFYITSCYSYKNLSTQDEYSRYSDIKKVHVLHVKTKQGDLIEFNHYFPGKISNGEVAGLPQLRLSFGEQDSIVYLTNNKIKAIWKNGNSYEFIKQDTKGFICHSSDSLKIPLSAVEQLRFQKFNTGGTIGLFAGIAVIILGIALYIDISENGWGPGY